MVTFLDPSKDYDNSYKHINNSKARDKVLEIIDNFSLIDIFREHHETLKRYTWRRTSPRKQARLDYFLVSENLISNTVQSSIEAEYRSDHSFPSISLKLTEFKTGKGIWKFNNSRTFKNLSHNKILI